MPAICLPHAVNAWGSADFSGILKREIERMDARQLPLQQGLVTGNVAIGDTLSATILSADEEAGFLCVKAGIFYSGTIAGCSCADDPTPVGEHPEYCEVQLYIDTATAEATITLVTDPH